jgi:hypothetical protein
VKPERIELTRSGGYANIPMRAAVAVDELGLDERAGIDALLRREPAGEAVAGAPDRFQYDVTVISADGRHRVRLGEQEIEEPLRPLIERLERDAKP